MQTRCHLGNFRGLPCPANAGIRSALEGTSLQTVTSAHSHAPRRANRHRTPPIPRTLPIRQARIPLSPERLSNRQPFAIYPHAIPSHSIPVNNSGVPVKQADLFQQFLRLYKSTRRPRPHSSDLLCASGRGPETAKHAVSHASSKPTLPG